MSVELKNIALDKTGEKLEDKIRKQFALSDRLLEVLEGWKEQRENFTQAMEQALGIPKEQFVYLLALELKKTPDEIREMALDDFNWLLIYVCAQRRANEEPSLP